MPNALPENFTSYQLLLNDVIANSPNLPEGSVPVVHEKVDSIQQPAGHENGLVNAIAEALHRPRSANVDDIRSAISMDIQNLHDQPDAMLQRVEALFANDANMPEALVDSIRTHHQNLYQVFSNQDDAIWPILSKHLQMKKDSQLSMGEKASLVIAPAALVCGSSVVTSAFLKTDWNRIGQAMSEANATTQAAVTSGVDLVVSGMAFNGLVGTTMVVSFGMVGVKIYNLAEGIRTSSGDRVKQVFEIIQPLLAVATMGTIAYGFSANPLGAAVAASVFVIFNMGVEIGKAVEDCHAPRHAIMKVQAAKQKKAAIRGLIFNAAVTFVVPTMLFVAYDTMEPYNLAVPVLGAVLGVAGTSVAYARKTIQQKAKSYFSRVKSLFQEKTGVNTLLAANTRSVMPAGEVASALAGPNAQTSVQTRRVGPGVAQTRSGRLAKRHAILPAEEAGTTNS